jgi:hypothetical protein
MKTPSYKRDSTAMMSTHNGVIRKRKAVKFQDRPPEVMTFISDSLESSWHSAETLSKIRDDAIMMAIDAYRDPRHAGWSSIFQQKENDVSCELLSMWTTNSNTLRGLERHVCASSYGQRRVNEHNLRMHAILQAQRRQKLQKQLSDKSDKESIIDEADAASMELATISRACSYPSRVMAIKMGKADSLAVSSDVMKSIKMSYSRLMTMKPGKCLTLSGHDLLPSSWLNQCSNSIHWYGATIPTNETIIPSAHKLTGSSPARSTVA